MVGGGTEKTMEAMSDVLSGGKHAKDKKKGHKIKAIKVRKGHEGGFIAQHEMEDEDGMPITHAPEYPMADMDAVHEHFDKHFGEGKGEKEDGKFGMHKEGKRAADKGQNEE